MKQKFSKSWKSSKRPGKQRKYAAHAPLHIKRKMLSVGLSKTLRKEKSTRGVVLRKGDTVRITRGKFKGKSGKIILVNIKTGRIEVENVQRKKQDGSMVNVPIRASNLQITELNGEDKRRFKTNKKEENKVKEPKKTQDKREQAKNKDKAPKSGDKK